MAVGMNPMDLNRGIDRVVEAVVKEIESARKRCRPTTRSPSALCWWTAYKDDSQMPAARVRCDLIGGLAGFRQLRRYGQGRGDRSRRKPRSAASSAAARRPTSEAGLS